MRTLLSVMGMLAIVFVPMATAGDPPANYACEAETFHQLGVATKNLGHAVVTGGDFNGDGFEDLIVTAAPRIEESPVRGAAALYLGPQDLGELVGGRITFQGDVVNGVSDLLGFAAAFVPDMNNDGRDEIVVGAPGWIDDKGTPSDTTDDVRVGQVLVILGENISKLEPPEVRDPQVSADLIIQGVVDGGRFGAAIAATGYDLGGGLGTAADLLVGAPGSLDSDDDDDCLGGGYVGAAHVFTAIGLLLPQPPPPAPPRYTADDSSWSGYGDNKADRFGHALAYIGDISGGPGEEFVIGAPQYKGDCNPNPNNECPGCPPPNVPLVSTGPGYARLYSGLVEVSVDWPTLGSGELEGGDGFGWAIAGDIDVGDPLGANGPDSVSDFLVSAFRANVDTNEGGAPRIQISAGEVWVFDGDAVNDEIQRHPDFSGGVNGTQLFGEFPFGQFGYSLSGVASIDSVDVVTDIIVGSNTQGGFRASGQCPDPLLDQGGSGSGAVRVIDGTGVADPLAFDLIVGEATLTSLGASVASGELDAIAGPDVLMGSPGWFDPDDPMKKRVGRGYVFSGPLPQQ